MGLGSLLLKGHVRVSSQLLLSLLKVLDDNHLCLAKFYLCGDEFDRNLAVAAYFLDTTRDIR